MIRIFLILSMAQKTSVYIERSQGKHTKELLSDIK